MYRFLAIILFFSWRLAAQDMVFTRVDPVNTEIINIKWYSDPLISEAGYNIYRKSKKSETWTRLNNTPMKSGEKPLDPLELQKDPQLKDYAEMAKNPSNLHGIAMLAVLIKSFRSDPFSKFLGIRFDDQLYGREDSVYYKVTIAGEQERLVGISGLALRMGYQPIDSPKEFISKSGKNEISFKWRPETSRYFGVEIFRKDSANAPFNKITKDPVILSKTKQKNGDEEYGETFFVDRNLVAGKYYEYYLKAIDFFGSESNPTASLRIYLKDLTAPGKVDSVFHSVDGRKVSLCWRKRFIEKDLAGYNIYRTNKNDSDYIRVNKRLILPGESAYPDSVLGFSSYMYMVSAVDKDSNETPSNPHLVEVFDNEPPQKPTGLQLTADSGKIILKWNKNTESDVAGYLIYRTINKDNSDNYVRLTPTPLNALTFEDRHPANAKNKFLYRIVAVDASLNRSPYSEFASAAMPDLFSPESPFLKTAEVFETRHVLLQWFANTEPDLAGYDIYRKVYGDESQAIRINSNLIHRSMTRYTDRHCEPGVHYTYYIIATDSSQNISRPSNQCSVHLKKRKAEALTIKDFKVDYNSKRNFVSVNWKLMEADSVKGVIVFRKSKEDVMFSPITALLVINKMTDEDVSRDSEYLYELRAYDNNGNSVRSQKVTINTITETKK